MSFKSLVIEKGLVGAIFGEVRKLAPSILRATASVGAVTAIASDPSILAAIPAGWVGVITTVAIVLKNAVQAIEGFIAYANSSSVSPAAPVQASATSVSSAHNTN